MSCRCGWSMSRCVRPWRRHAGSSGSPSSSWPGWWASSATCTRSWTGSGVDETLVRCAGVLSQEQALRGYHAVHLAAVERIAGEDVVLVSGDVELCAAAHDVSARLGPAPRSFLEDMAVRGFVVKAHLSRVCCSVDEAVEVVERFGADERVSLVWWLFDGVPGSSVGVDVHVGLL